jgi:AcrR family transcriptional regulator
VGIDTILAKSDCAKASLYSNFKNKVELAIAFLDRREAIWTRGWLESEIKRRAKTPEDQLLAIFDVFDGWFHNKTFEGCSFINVLLESKVDSPIRQAAAIHLAKIRAIGKARLSLRAKATEMPRARRSVPHGLCLTVGNARAKPHWLIRSPREVIRSFFRGSRRQIADFRRKHAGERRHEEIERIVQRLSMAIVEPPGGDYDLWLALRLLRSAN